MKNRILILAISTILVSSCVSPKVYKDLENKYSTLKSENRELKSDNENLMSAKNAAQNELDQLHEAYNEAVADRDKLQNDYNVSKSNLDALKASYDALEKNSSSAIAQNAQKNRELLGLLEAKKNALAAENARLEALKKELDKE